MKKIKFSHRYYKMPEKIEWGETIILEIFVADFKSLSYDFIKYDISYEDENGDCHEYELPETKLLVILFQTVIDGRSYLWTTMRRWTQQKEVYYRSIIGQTVEIEIIKHEVQKSV